MASLHKYLLYAARVGVYSEWHKWLFTMYQWLSSSASGLAHVGIFTRKRVDARIASDSSATKNSRISTEPEDFLSKLLTLRANDPEKIGKNEIFSVCFANIGAGSDTTSISLNAVLYYLIKSPETLSTLRQEIKTGRMNGALSNPITFREAQQHMPYLQAVIKEALRLHPAAAYPLLRIVPEGAGVDIAGHHFLPGVSMFAIGEGKIHTDLAKTTLGASSWVAHSNKAVFGEDSRAFRPERWLEDRETVKRREAYFMTVCEE